MENAPRTNAQPAYPTRIWLPGALITCANRLAAAAARGLADDHLNAPNLAALVTATCWHESGGLYYVTGDVSPKDGIPRSYGIGQVQRGSAIDSLRWLALRAAVNTNITQALYGPGFAVAMPLTALSAVTVLSISTVFHPFSVAMSLLHYLRKEVRGPQTPEEAANVWKEVYNTKRGAGTPKQFLTSLSAFPLPLRFTGDAKNA